MRLLIAVSRYPFPPRRGDQLRAVQMAGLLAPAHDVTLLSPGPPPSAPGPPPDLPYRLETHPVPGWLRRAAEVPRAGLRGLPLQSGLFRSLELERALRRLAPRHDLAILQLVRLAHHVPDLAGTPYLVDLIDSLSLSFERRAGYDRRWLRPLLRHEARSLARWEHRLVAGSRGALVVAERDREAIARGLAPGLAGRIRVVPVAVPPRVPEAPAARPERPFLAITGNLGYFPTVEGTMWLLREVWPELRTRRPDLRLVLAGSRLPELVARAAAQAGAETRPVPADLGAEIAGATASLAPMRCGAGQPLKVMEAWSAGVPVVATPWTVRGTTGRPGEDLLAAESGAEWVRAVLALLEDPALGARLAAAGRRRLAADYAPEVVAAALADAVTRAGR